MKLEKKKALVARALKVGKNRIRFNISRLSELKEAITKQDIKDLKEAGAITLKEVQGRLKKKKRKTRSRSGSFKKKIKTQKRDYINVIRKLRSYLANLKKQNKISNKSYLQLRKEIRTKAFKSLGHMKEYISQTLEEE